MEDIKKEIAWCMTYDQAEECCGASGHKLRTVCVWCQKYWKYHHIEKQEGLITMGTEASQERIGKLEEKIDSMWNKIMEMASSLAVMTAKMEGLVRDVEEMKSTPKNRWNNVINTFITVLVTGFIAYLIAEAKAPVK